MGDVELCQPHDALLRPGHNSVLRKIRIKKFGYYRVHYIEDSCRVKNCTVRRTLLKQVKYKIALLLHSL